MVKSQTILHSPVASSPPIPVAEPEDAGLRRDALDRVNLIIQKQYPKMRSFLLLHAGKLIYERYYGGHGISSLNDLRSATKSFTSALCGIALSRGELPELKASVTDIFQRYVPQRAHPLLRNVSLHHLLTMTSGFAWQTGESSGNRSSTVSTATGNGRASPYPSLSSNRKWADSNTGAPIPTCSPLRLARPREWTPTPMPGNICSSRSAFAMPPGPRAPRDTAWVISACILPPATWPNSVNAAWTGDSGKARPSFLKPGLSRRSLRR